MYESSGGVHCVERPLKDAQSPNTAPEVISNLRATGVESTAEPASSKLLGDGSVPSTAFSDHGEEYELVAERWQDGAYHGSGAHEKFGPST